MNTLDMTMEVSAVKRAPAAQLPSFYTNNKAAIAAFMLWPTTSTRTMET